MATYKTRAISLKTSPFAEADKLVTLFTRERGKVRALAKGARRVPSRFGGRVETLTYSDLLIVSCRSIDIISQCQVLESFQSVREDSQTLYPGLYMLKLVNSGTSDGQYYPELFDLLLSYLLRLKDGKMEGWRDGGTGRKIVKEFVREFVKIEGIHQMGMDPLAVLGEHLERDLSIW
ncbi:MAG: DNA repair protein RecO [bacterium]